MRFNVGEITKLVKSSEEKREKVLALAVKVRDEIDELENVLSVLDDANGALTDACVALHDASEILSQQV